VREVVLVRIDSGDQGTFGVLAFGRDSCRSLELPWRNNRRQVSCIPTGRYRCTAATHSRMGRVYRVHDVPGRDGVLIHSANLAGDVRLRWDSHLQGCIAPFDKPGMLKNKVGEWQRAGLVSRPALSRLIAWGAGQPFDLVIREF
jgi:hypothetical protein